MKVFLLLLILAQIPLELHSNDEVKFQIDPPVLIFRVPTFSAKINYLDNQINKTAQDPSYNVSLRREKEKTIQKKDKYFSYLVSIFKQAYSIGDVLFVPDTLYKRYLDGDMTVFINDTGKFTSIDLHGKKLIHMIQGKDEYQLLLTDKYGNRLASPWPYKKNTFFSSFKQLYNSESYLYNQIIWFDKKIKMAMYMEIKI